MTLGWEEFKRSGVFAVLSYTISRDLWNLFQENNQLSVLVTRVTDEFEGKQPVSDFSREFTKAVLEYLPRGTSQELVWSDLTGAQRMRPSLIPAEIVEEAAPRLFKEAPAKARVLCESYNGLLAPLMFDKLDTGKLESSDEASLLFSMALACGAGEIPDEWIEVLRTWNRTDLESFLSESRSKKDLPNWRTLNTLISSNESD